MENGDGNGDRNGKGGPAGAAQGRERQKGSWAQAGGSAGAGTKKRSPLVGDVLAYWAAYEWDGAD